MVLDSWYYFVAGMKHTELEERLVQIAGVQTRECSLEGARGALASGKAATYIVRESTVCIVQNSGRHTFSNIRLLNDLVGAYKGRADILCASDDNWIKQSPYYPCMNPLVVFMRYTPADVFQVARSGDKIPSGVFRHSIPNRALVINIPLNVLEEALS